MNMRLKAVILRIQWDTYCSIFIHLSLNGGASINQHFLIMATVIDLCILSNVCRNNWCMRLRLHERHRIFVCNNGTTATGICGAMPTFETTRLLCWYHPCSESSHAWNSFRQKGAKKLKITFEVCRMRKSPTCSPCTWTADASSAPALLGIHVLPPNIGNTTQRPSSQNFLQACDCQYPG